MASKPEDMQEYCEACNEPLEIGQIGICGSCAQMAPRIIGTFTKQQWDGRNNSVHCGEEEFDATDHILLMEPAAVRQLQDDRENTDCIGQAHVSWNGPHQVSIVDSICEFFGVDDVSEITDEAMADARERLNPQPATEEVIQLVVKLKVRIAGGASVKEFIENLDYSVISKTAGITVTDTEIVDC